MVTKVQAENRCRDYLNHLFDVFSFLVRYSRVQTDVPTMHHSCVSTEAKLAAVKRRQKGFSGFGISLDPNWEIPLDPCPVHGVNGDAKLVIGGIIDVSKGPKIKQSIVIAILLEALEHVALPNSKQSEALAKGDRVLIRRFHFDYDTALASPCYPRSHLQYGGKFSGHIAVPNVEYRLYAIDMPRIPFPPFDLVLAIDFFLRQFQTPLQDMVEESRWLNLVKESERLWLRGYFQELADHLTPRDRKKTFYKRLSDHVDWIG